MRLQHGYLLAVFFLVLASPGSVVHAAAGISTDICLPEDNQTCLILSDAAAGELIAANNTFGEDILVSVKRVAGEETGIVLRSIRITATGADSGRAITDFSFKNPVELRLGNWTLFQTDVVPAVGVPLAPVNDVLQWLSVNWENAGESIRLGGLSLDENQSLSVTVHNIGQYQVLVEKRAATLALSHGSPYPRIITPNNHNNRRAFFFIDTPNTDSLIGTIFDFRGAKIRDLRVDAQSPAPNALVWDGRDQSGNVVPSGPYMYKISAGGQHISGGLVVAR